MKIVSVSFLKTPIRENSAPRTFGAVQWVRTCSPRHGNTFILCTLGSVQYIVMYAVINALSLPRGAVLSFSNYEQRADCQTLPAVDSTAGEKHA